MNNGPVALDELTESTPNDWSFYTDDENKVYYIDFEAINVNLNDIVVKDEYGQVVFKEHVLELPVNTIYELDLTQFPSGNYRIELRSFTKVIKKELQVK